MMNPLSASAQDEIQAGRAVPLEVALKQILESVEEVVSYTIDEPQMNDVQVNSPLTSDGTVHFQCRLHAPFSIPLTRLCVFPGIVSNATVNNMILLLRTHTGETITFKR